MEMTNYKGVNEFKVVLCDLDGTLLPMEMNRFLQAYLGRLSLWFASSIDPKHFVQVLLSATNAMIENTDPTKTNEDVFRESFFPELGVKPDRMMPEFEHFYENEFPDLHKYTEPTPLARRVLDAAVARGCDLVLATNPIFPHVAIKERMRWAGIVDLPFSLITDYERMHFCKPKLQYYEEILHRIGVSPKDCLMVGNDLAEDMIAAELGMSTFLVEDCLIENNGDPAHAHHRGRLDDLLQFFQRS